MLLLAVITVAAAYYTFGEWQALALFYGAGTGILSFVSTAVTVSLLGGSSKAIGMLLGASSFGARYCFAIIALGVPAYLELWPVGAMLAGFAGVYFVETVMLVPWAVRTMRIPGAEVPVGEGVERRTEI